MYLSCLAACNNIYISYNTVLYTVDNILFWWWSFPQWTEWQQDKSSMRALSSGLESLFNFQVNLPCHARAAGNIADFNDRRKFVDVLKQMLQLDASTQITPSQVLERPFISMGHLVDIFHHSSQWACPKMLCAYVGGGSWLIHSFIVFQCQVLF